MSAGKGDSPRKVIGDKYRDNYDYIFGKPEWPDVIGGGRLATEPYVWDGPEPIKPRPREFMKTNTEGDE